MALNLNLTECLDFGGEEGEQTPGAITHPVSAGVPSGTLADVLSPIAVGGLPSSNPPPTAPPALTPAPTATPGPDTVVYTGEDSLAGPLTAPQLALLSRSSTYGKKYIAGTARAVLSLLQRAEIRSVTRFEDIERAAARSETSTIEFPRTGRAAAAYYAERTPAGESLTAAITAQHTRWINRFGGSQHKSRWASCIRQANIIDIGVAAQGVAYLFEPTGEALMRDVDADLNFFGFAANAPNCEVTAAQVAGIDQERVRVSNTGFHVRPAVARNAREQAKALRGTGDLAGGAVTPKN